MKKMLACSLLAAVTSLPVSAEPYVWQKIKVKTAKGRVVTIKLDYGIVRLHDGSGDAMRKFVHAVEILKHTTDVPNVPNTQYGVVLSVSTPVVMRGVIDYPTAPDKRTTYEWKDHAVADYIRYVQMLDSKAVPGEVHLTIYVEGQPIRTIDFNILPAAATYTNVEKGFSIEFPPDWEQKQDKNAKGVVAISPTEGPDDEFLESISVGGMERIEGSSSKGYREFSEAILQVLPGYKKHDSGKTKIGPLTARWIVYSHRLGDAPVKVLHYFIVSGDKAFMITATASEESFDKYRPTFEQTVNSFRLSDKE